MLLDQILNITDQSLDEAQVPWNRVAPNKKFVGYLVIFFDGFLTDQSLDEAQGPLDRVASNKKFTGYPAARYPVLFLPDRYRIFGSTYL